MSGHNAMNSFLVRDGIYIKHKHFLISRAVIHFSERRMTLLKSQSHNFLLRFTFPFPLVNTSGQLLHPNSLTHSIWYYSKSSTTSQAQFNHFHAHYISLTCNQGVQHFLAKGHNYYRRTDRESHVCRLQQLCN